MLFEMEIPCLVVDMPANQVKFLTFFGVFWKMKGLNPRLVMRLENQSLICKNDLE